MKKMKVNATHWKELLDFAENHPDIITLKWGKIQDRKDLLSLWKEISIKLNNMGMGIKSIKQWRKAFSDWKLKVKGKQSAILEQLKYGGTVKPLNDNEKRLLQLLGYKKLVYSEKNQLIPDEEDDEQEEIEIKTEPLLFEVVNCNDSIKRELSDEEIETSSIAKKQHIMPPETVNVIPIEIPSLDFMPNNSRSRKSSDNDARSNYDHTDVNIESDSEASNNHEDNNYMLQFTEMHEETIAVLCNIASSLESIASSLKKLEEGRTSTES